MKLLQTIRVDPSDTFIFETAAAPGEWAVSGGFMFAGQDPATFAGKARAAFRGGFLGLGSFGWSTLVQIVDASEADRAAAVELLALRLVERFGAPDLATARPAAEEEIAFAASLCDHPIGRLAAVSRRVEDGSIREQFRTLRPGPSREPTRVFSLIEAPDEEDAPMERIDFAALAKGERP
ncbi:MAG: DUF6505 family protein [Methylocella sp.]